MSSKKFQFPKLSRLIKGIIGTVGALGIIAAVLLPGSGANLSASDTGTVNVGTATLTLSLGDDNGSSGTFNLNFPNLKPGQSLTQTFYVKNTGSIQANASIGAPTTGNFTVPSGQNPNPAKLKAGVDNYLALTPITGLSTINLGTLNAGETKGFTLRIGLDSSAGNEWQNVHVGGTATVTLNQA